MATPADYDILSREPGNMIQHHHGWTRRDWITDEEWNTMNDEMFGPVDDELEQLREKAKAEQFRRDTMYHEEPAW